MALISVSVSAQELDSLRAIMGNKEEQNPGQDRVKVDVGNKELIKVMDNHDSTYVKLGDNKLIEVIDQPDSTRIRVGNKEISIVENNDKTDIHMGRIHDVDRHHTPKFRGHWAGFEWGINNFLDNENTLSREGDAAFMDLNTSRSWAINLNFAQYSLGFGTTHFGLVTGFGLEFNNYFFDNNNSLVELNDQVVSEPLDGTHLAKSKLTTTFLRVPLMLEGQFPGTIRGRRVFISAGLISGIKLGSHTKVVYKDGGKDKSKNRDDFNINPFRYGLTARLGYGCMSIFGDYYITPMFVKDKGPSLHPFSVGLAFTF
jgi:hypothetical protein